MVKLVDTTDLSSVGQRCPCRFKSYWEYLVDLLSGIYELTSDSKVIEPYGFYGDHAFSQESHVLWSWKYAKNNKNRQPYCRINACGLPNYG